jgi:hypothetical protein
MMVGERGPLLDSRVRGCLSMFVPMVYAYRMLEQY